MRAADLVVTKAWPGAVAASLATGVPLVLTGYRPGQETANVRFVTGAGFGLVPPRRVEPEAGPGDEADVGRLLPRPIPRQHKRYSGGQRRRDGPRPGLGHHQVGGPH